MNPILRRILEAADDPLLIDRLDRLSGADFRSLWLHLVRMRVRDLTPAQLLREAADKRFEASDLDPRAVRAMEDRFFDRVVAGTELRDLSPVAPLGIDAVLGDIDTNSVLAGARGQVLADPTSSMALECARRRRAGDDVVRLGTSARVLRMQPLARPEFTRHFTVFALATAARDRGHLAFERQSLTEHLGVYVAVLQELGIDSRVALTDLTGGRIRKRLGRMAVDLHAALGVPVALDEKRQQGRAYYRTLCFTLWCELGPIADGGFVDWTARMLCNDKERLLTSGIGIDVLVRKTSGS